MFFILEDKLLDKRIYIQASSYVEARFFVDIKVNEFYEKLKNYISGNNILSIDEATKFYLSDTVFIQFPPYPNDIEAVIKCIDDGGESQYELFDSLFLYQLPEDEIISL